jgi:simple sugar transport system permease protein
MRVMGDSPTTAKYAGIRTRRKIVSIMAVSGAIAGMAGASQIGDFGHVLDPRGLQQAQYGYTGIVVAALALYNPLAVVLVAVLIGGLTNAGFALEGPGFPTGLVGTMEGIIIFSVLGGEILARYHIGFGHKRSASVSPVAGEPGPAPGPVQDAATAKALTTSAPTSEVGL